MTEKKVSKRSAKKALDERIIDAVRQLPGVHTYEDGENWVRTREENIKDLILEVLKEWNL